MGEVELLPSFQCILLNFGFQRGEVSGVTQCHRHFFCSGTGLFGVFVSDQKDEAGVHLLGKALNRFLKEGFFLKGR